MTMKLTFVAALFCLSAVGCKSIDQAADCHAICTRYKDCFDDTYDVSACQDRCENMIDSDPHAADDCEACIDDRSCTEAIFPCADECNSIVP